MLTQRLKSLPDPCRAQPFALEIEESDFIERIEQAQVAAELETIDDYRLWQETDVLGPQVAVAFDIDPLIGSALKQRLHFVKAMDMCRMTRSASA